MWNVTSMINKTESIMEHLKDHNPSVAFISETWLKTDKNHVTSLVKDYGYILLHNRRKNREKELGGGVGILLKSGMISKQMDFRQYSSFELLVVKIYLKDKQWCTLACIYRVLFVPITVFLEEIVQLFEILVSLNERIILAGDINIHMDENELYANRFKDILYIFNIYQHVNFPTHNMGHTIDIIATFDNNPVISNLVANELTISHHYLVNFEVAINAEVRNEKTIWFRKISMINSDVFQNNITDKLIISDCATFKENVSMYNEVLMNQLNTLAPLKSKNIKIVPNAPWFDTEYENLRKLRRKAEKEYRRTGLQVHKENYRNLRKQTTDLAFLKKRKYYSDKIDNCPNNKTLFSVINKLLDKNQELILPSGDNDKQLANSFAVFFTKKIENIRSKFQDVSTLTYSNYAGNKLTSFQCVTTDEIYQIVLSFGLKCSPEDPIPADLLKKNIDVMVPIWTKLVNMSLVEGTMDSLKNAVVLPLIKDLDSLIDIDNKKNYRPVSNLLYVGKLIERVVSIQLNHHMSINNLHSSFQFGYKKGHSTETLLLKVIDNLLNNCDKQIPSILMLLDLSAAFDTVDQSKLLSILKEEIGIDGTALKWFHSFLKGRTQKVKIRNDYSAESLLLYGVPQGSVLGPNLFNIYTRSLYKYIEPSKFDTVGFADDHQLVKSFLPTLQSMALGADIRYCFNLITKWMSEFFLCLNPSKTKILIIAPPSIKSEIVINGTFINDSCIRFVSHARNLGVILDSEISFTNQINSVVKSCFHIIRKLSKIKSFLTYSQLSTAICACVLSRLDYCNSLYYGVNSEVIKKLQSVQSSAARLLKKKKGITNLSTNYILRNHHWLPVKERIIFKTSLLVHKCLHGNAPSLLSNLLLRCSSSRTNKLNQKHVRSNYGERSFSRFGPKIWNCLPDDIRMENDIVKFKNMLKTYLFDNFLLFSHKLCEQ